ncbi:MAG TPA: hypothetical protein VLE53_15070 [Gemmatimonadaceae bacterium]|nr:hypothetical protein [Gemmatimonadaceae bacterium]
MSERLARCRRHTPASRQAQVKPVSRAKHQANYEPLTLSLEKC